MRRFGEPRQKGVSYRDRPGAYAVLVRDGQILLTYQGGETKEFQLPGGGIDPGETSIAALHREVREETGYAISDLRRFGVYQRYTFMPEYDLWARKICHIFVARPTLSKGRPTEEEHVPFWTSPEEAVELVASSGDAFFLNRFLHKV